MSRQRFALALLALALATTAGLACASEDDAERLAAQRLFRTYLIQQDATAAADVRIQKWVDELPPDFPLAEGLSLLGSAFSDTDDRRELIVGWSSRRSADELYEFYSGALNEPPWEVVRDPRLVGIDFIQFRDADHAAFLGEVRIAQEGDEAVVLLIAREFLQPQEDVPTGS